MTELHYLAASLVALAVTFPVVVAVAILVFGMADGDAAWVALLSWAGNCAWRDWRRLREPTTNSSPRP